MPFDLDAIIDRELATQENARWDDPEEDLDVTEL